jgi:hypothetical protein
VQLALKLSEKISGLAGKLKDYQGDLVALRDRVIAGKPGPVGTAMNRLMAKE